MDRPPARPAPRAPRAGSRKAARRRTRQRVVAAVVGVLALTASAVACTAQATAPTASSTTATSTPTPSPTPTTPPPPPPPPPVYWPLTGVESGAVPPHPALAVKIENSVDARPQSGLNAADIVWEAVVEGGITRFVAVYHSTLPPQIGPIRSVRPMDPAIAAPLHGLFAFSGGQRPMVDAISASGLQVVSHDRGHGGFFRLNTRYAPHNVYADPADFLAQADPAHQADPAPQFAIARPDQKPTALATGAPAAVVSLKLSGLSFPKWTWYAPHNTWLRSEGTTPAVEPDRTQLRATNVVVLRVALVATHYTDVTGNPVPETQMVGSGEALVATGGRTVTATWTKNSPAEPVTLTGADGQPVLLAPGNTWVELVPTRTGAVTVG